MKEKRETEETANQWRYAVMAIITAAPVYTQARQLNFVFLKHRPPLLLVGTDGFVVIIICMLVALAAWAWFFNRKISSNNTQLTAAQQQLKQLNQHLEETVAERTEKLQKTVNELSAYKYSLDQSAIVAITDQKGIINYVNDTFCRISQYSREELIGQDHRIINSGHHGKDFIRNMWVAIAHGQTWKGEFKNRAKNGTCYWVDTTIIPFLNEAGKPTQYLSIRYEITERKKAEEELIKANRLYAFISAINQSVVHLTNQQTLLDNACDVAVRIGQFRIARATLLDESTQTLKIVSIHGDKSVVDAMKKYAVVGIDHPVLNGTPTARVLKTEHYVVSNDVQNDPAFVALKKEFAEVGARSIISFPLKRFGKVIGIFSLQSGEVDFFDDRETAMLEEVAMDISFGLENIMRREIRARNEALILQNEARLKKAQSIAHFGHWELDLATGLGEWSEESCRIYGLDPADNKHSYESWVSFLHPDDLTYVMGVLQEQQQTLKPAAYEHRIIRRDGSIRHVHSEGMFEFDANGKPVALYGISHDITEQKLAEARIEFDRNNLDALINNTGDFMWSVDLNCRIITYNQPLAKMLKIFSGREIAKGDDMLSFSYSNEQAALYKGYYQRAFAGEAFTVTEYTGAPADLWAELSFYPIREGDKVIGSACYSRDITERKNAEEKIRRNEVQLNEAQKIAKIGSWEVNMIDHSQAWSDELFSIYGIEKCTPTTELYLSFVHPDDKARAMEGVAQTMKTNQGSSADFRFIRGDGAIRHAHAAWQFEMDKDGKPLRLYGIVHDVTEQKLAEEKLRRNESQLKDAQVIAGLGSWEMDMVNNGLAWSDEMFHILGYLAGEVEPSNETFFSMVHPDDAEYINNRFASAITQFESSSSNFRLIRKDGAVRHAFSEWKFELDDNGQPVRMYGIVQDVTEQKRVEERLRKSEAKLIEAQSIAGLGSFEIDLATNAVQWSDEQYHLLGYNRGDIRPDTMVLFSMVHPLDLPSVRQQFAHAMETLEPGTSTFRLIRNDGVTIYTYCRWQFEFDDIDKPVRLYGILQDVTERVKHHEEQELFAAIVNSSDDAIISKTLDGVISSWNHGAERVLGYRADEVVGRHISVIIPPHLQGEENRILGQIKWGQSVDHYETERVRKDGVCIAVSLTVSPLRDAAGQVNGASKILRDITGKKKAEAEIQTLNESLERRVTERTAQLTEANKALESFTYSVSQDLRAPVRTIIGFTKMIQKEYGAGFEPGLKELFEYLESGGNRMNAIIDDMLTLAKYEKGALKIARVNMEHLFTLVWNHIAQSTPHTATLVMDTLPVVDADASMIEQVIVNLLSNAVKYSSKKEKPVVNIGCEKNDTHLTFFVKDNGAGFDMKNYHRLFGAFQRLHSISDFEGTGVGLLLVKKIVEKHGGLVWAEGKENEGATFYFTLPCATGV